MTQLLSDRRAVYESTATASALARTFAETAAERDRAGGTPKAERDLLRRSGLLSLLVPERYGGRGASWPEIFDGVRSIARADASLAHVFGFQHLMLATVRLFGSLDQWAHFAGATVRNDWFWGNALNPLDPRTSLAKAGSGFVLNGIKSFCSGSVDSDALIVSALREDSRLAVLAIPSDRRGVSIQRDWDNMGQRQTDSGTVEFREVVVEASELLQTPGPLGSVFATLRPCIAQLTLANVYLGTAEGAFDVAKPYSRGQRRAWPASGLASPTEDPYLLRDYGELWLALESARLLADRAAVGLQAAWELGDDLSPARRGEVALSIAAAKVATTQSGLDVTNRVFEVMGARATTSKANIDRFWRNVRTLTLHDPVAYKLRELGKYALADELPTPSFYS